MHDCQLSSTLNGVYMMRGLLCFWCCTWWPKRYTLSRYEVGKAISIDQGELSGVSTCLFCNALNDSPVCGDCLQQEFHSCEPSFYDTEDCEGRSSQVLSTASSDTPLNTAVHMPFSIDEHPHARSSIYVIQQHLVGNQNMTDKNTTVFVIPPPKKPNDVSLDPSLADGCEPSAGGTFFAPGVLRPKNSYDGVLYTTAYQSSHYNTGGQQAINLIDLSVEPAPDVGRSSSLYNDLWREIRTRVVTNSFHTTDYESTPSNSSSQLSANLANCSDAPASGSGFAPVQDAPATSACINSRHSNIRAPESAYMGIQGLSRSYIGVSTSDQQCHHGANGQRGVSWQLSLATNLEDRNTYVPKLSYVRVGGHSRSYIDVSTSDQQRHPGDVIYPVNVRGHRVGNQDIPIEICEDDFRTASLAYLAIPFFDTLFLDRAAHSRSYIGISTFDQQRHPCASRQRGVSRQCSPATSSGSSNFNINVRIRLSYSQPSFTAPTLLANFQNRNTDVPELSFARAEGYSPTNIDIGDCTYRGYHCGALFWYGERLKALHLRHTEQSWKQNAPFWGADEGGLNPEIVERLIHILDDHNELVQFFRSAQDKCKDNNVEEFKIRLYDTGGLRGYELPTSQCVGGIVFKIGPRSGRLFQQYVAAVYCALEQSRMDYIRTHQSDVRSEYLSGLYDVVLRGDHDGVVVGSKIILPTSFTGGLRYMYSHYLDALAICQTLGNPQFFNTFTCNVNWPEIKRCMAQYPALTPADRADVVCRVFEQ
nr:DNA helicase [Tanacetum cinerariifolium]